MSLALSEFRQALVLSPWISACEPAFGVTPRDTVRQLIGATALTLTRTLADCGGQHPDSGPEPHRRRDSWDLAPRAGTVQRECCGEDRPVIGVAGLGRRPLGESRRPEQSGV